MLIIMFSNFFRLLILQFWAILANCIRQDSPGSFYLPFILVTEITSDPTSIRFLFISSVKRIRPMPRSTGFSSGSLKVW